MSKINIKLSNSFTHLLTVLFIGLKLTGYINWSWWWVLSPIWIPLVIALILCIILIIFKVWMDLK